MELVKDWLEHHGVDPNAVSRSTAGDWLTVSLPVSLAEAMLDAKYSVYHKPSEDVYLVRTTSYALPAVLQEHVNVIAPTTHFGQMRPMRATSSSSPSSLAISQDEAKNQLNALSSGQVPSSCNTTITPACLKALYNTVGYVPQATKVNKLGIAGYLNEFANDADLQVRSIGI